jgi:hypothetical protein
MSSRNVYRICKKVTKQVEQKGKKRQELFVMSTGAQQHHVMSTGASRSLPLEGCPKGGVVLTPKSTTPPLPQRPSKGGESKPSLIETKQTVIAMTASVLAYF